MPNAKDLDNNPKIRALFIGKSGTRKSTVAASFPKPIYCFDFDGRIAGLRGLDVDYDSYPRVAGWKKAEDKFSLFLAQMRGGTLPYKTLMVSSVTTILDFFLWEAKEHYKTLTDDRGKPTGFRVNRPGNSGSILMSDMPHYKYVHSALDSLLYDYILPLGLGVNVLVEAHETTQFEKDGTPKGDKVLASDAIAERLPTIFDETWQFKYNRAMNPTQPGDYKVFFRNNDLAKTTFRKLPDSVVINNKETVFYDEIFMKEINK